MKRLFTFSIMLLTASATFAQNPAPCSDLFFSEYIEGTSFNKVIEIYNPTSVAVNLSDYKLLLFANGSPTPTSTFTMFGNLMAGGVYIVTNPNDTSVYINSIADTTAGTVNFTGNDAFALLKISTTDTIDRIGQIGIDPGAAVGWPVGSGNTSDHTLVRKMAINNGQSDWLIGSTEWDVYPLNNFTQLGAHTMTPCAATPPDVYLINATQNVNEGDGSITLELGIINPDANATSVTLTLSDISATITQDYDLTGNPVTVTFPAGSSANQTVSVSIIDDTNIETAETFNVAISNPTNNATISTVQEVVTIQDNDTPGPEVYLVNATQSVSETDGSINIQVGINNPNANATSVILTLSDISASIGSDYDLTGNPVTVIFPAGSSANQIVSVTIINDANLELDETFNVSLSNTTNNATITVSQEIVTITNVDINSYIGFWLSVDSVSETMPVYSATLEMFSGTTTIAPTSVDVSLVIAQSTATEGVDFTFNDTTITWPAGPPNSQYAIFHLIDDGIIEPTEHFVLTLSNFTNNSALNTNLSGSMQINITDNDPNSINEILNNKKVMLIPNPTNEKTLLLTNGKFEYFEIRDSAGKLLQATNIHNQKTATIIITDLSPGAYFVIVHNGKNSETLKLIKQ